MSEDTHLGLCGSMRSTRVSRESGRWRASPQTQRQSVNQTGLVAAKGRESTGARWKHNKKKQHRRELLPVNGALQQKVDGQMENQHLSLSSPVKIPNVARTKRDKNIELDVRLKFGLNLLRFCFLNYIWWGGGGGGMCA